MVTLTVPSQRKSASHTCDYCFIYFSIFYLVNWHSIEEDSMANFQSGALAGHIPNNTFMHFPPILVTQDVNHSHALLDPTILSNDPYLCAILINP